MVDEIKNNNNTIQRHKKDNSAVFLWQAEMGFLVAMEVIKVEKLA